MAYARKDGNWLLCDDAIVKVVEAVDPIWPYLAFIDFSGKIASEEQEQGQRNRFK